MEDKIKKLHTEGKSYREIAKTLGIPKSTIHRVVSQNRTVPSVPNDELIKSGTVSDTVKKDKCLTGCPFGKNREECELYKETNKEGIRKLRSCNYTKQELKEFPDAPYFKCYN